MMPSDPHGDGVVMTAGVALAEARSVLILLHGRGGSAQDILDLGMELGDASTAYLAHRLRNTPGIQTHFSRPSHRMNHG